MQSLLTLRLDSSVLTAAGEGMALAAAAFQREVAASESKRLLLIRVTSQELLKSAAYFSQAPSSDAAAGFKFELIELLVQSLCDSGPDVGSSSSGLFKSMHSEFKRLVSSTKKINSSKETILSTCFMGKRWEEPAAFAFTLTDLLLVLGEAAESESPGCDQIVRLMQWLAAGDGEEFGGLVELLSFGEAPSAWSAFYALSGIINRLVASNDEPQKCISELLTLLSSECETVLLSVLTRLGEAVFDEFSVDVSQFEKGVQPGGALDELKDMLKAAEARSIEALAVLKFATSALGSPMALLNRSVSVLTKLGGFTFENLALTAAEEVKLKVQDLVGALSAAAVETVEKKSETVVSKLVDEVEVHIRRLLNLAGSHVASLSGSDVLRIVREQAVQVRKQLSEGAIELAKIAAEALSEQLNKVLDVIKGAAKVSGTATDIFDDSPLGTTKKAIVMLAATLGGIAGDLDALMESGKELIHLLEGTVAASLKSIRALLPGNSFSFSKKKVDAQELATLLSQLHASISHFNSNLKTLSSNCPQFVEASVSLLSPDEDSYAIKLVDRPNLELLMSGLVGSAKGSLAHAVTSITEAATEELASVTSAVGEAIKSASATVGSSVSGAMTGAKDFLGAASSALGGASALLNDLVKYVA